MISCPTRRTLLAAAILSATLLFAVAQAPPASTSVPPAPNSQLELTLMKLRQRNDMSALSANDRRVIGDHVRACWSKDSGTTEANNHSVLLTVTTDVSGVVRIAQVAASDTLRVNSDPRLHVLAERAMQALLDPRCAKLPLPSTALGRVNILSFQFRP
jgi:hypothetical protein